MEVLVCGDGRQGCLGRGNKESAAQFCPSDVRDVRSVVCGSYNTAVVTSGGSLKICGLTNCPKDGSSLVGYKVPTDGPIPDECMNWDSFSCCDRILPAEIRKFVSGSGDDSVLSDEGEGEVLPVDESVKTGANARMSFMNVVDKTVLRSSVLSPSFLGASSAAELMKDYPMAIKQIALGNYHGLMLTTDGSVYAWGSSRFGQLGLGSLSHSLKPRKITTLSCVKAIACGTTFSAAITEWGELYTWGENSVGQLGLGDITNRSLPTRVTALKNTAVEKFAASANRCVCVTAHQEVYFWGQNAREVVMQVVPRKLDTSAMFKPPTTVSKIACAGWHTTLVLSTGQVWEWPLGEAPHPVQGPLLTESIRDVACGNFHTMAISDRGCLYSWGRNAASQLGRPDVASTDQVPGLCAGIAVTPQDNGTKRGPVVKVSSGEFHNAVLIDRSARYSAACNLLGVVREYFRELTVLIYGYYVPLFEKSFEKLNQALVLQRKRSKIVYEPDEFLSAGYKSRIISESRMDSYCKASAEMAMLTDNSVQVDTKFSGSISPEKKKPAAAFEFIKYDDFVNIFSNIEKIYFDTADLIALIEERIGEWSENQTMGDALLSDQVISALREYVIYADHYLEAQELLSTLRANSFEFSEFIDKLENPAKEVVFPTITTSYAMHSLLFVPAQFIGRLVLCTREMVKGTLAGHQDFLPVCVFAQKCELLLQRVALNFQLSEPLDILNLAPDASGKSTLMGGSLKSLVSLLTHPTASDKEYQSIFFLMRETFCTSSELFDAFVEHFKQVTQQSADHQLHFFIVLGTWMDEDWESFKANDYALCNRVEEFIRDGIPKACRSGAALLSMQIEDARENGATPQTGYVQRRVFEIATRNMSIDRTLFDYDANTIAHAFACYDQFLLGRIPVSEFLGAHWTKEGGKLCPKLRTFTTHFNGITKWVSDSINGAGKQKGAVANFMIAIAEESLAISSLNTFMAIIIALELNEKAIKKELTKENAAKLAKFQTLASPAQNYKAYRTHMETVSAPCVPFVGLILKDLAAIEEANPDNINGLVKNAEGEEEERVLINFYKRRRYGSIVLKTVQMQNVMYDNYEKDLEYHLSALCMDI